MKKPKSRVARIALYPIAVLHAIWLAFRRPKRYHYFVTWSIVLPKDAISKSHSLQYSSVVILSHRLENRGQLIDLASTLAKRAQDDVHGELKHDNVFIYLCNLIKVSR